MREGVSQPTERNQTANAGAQPTGVRPRAPRFAVERETARTTGQGPKVTLSVK